MSTSTFLSPPMAANFTKGKDANAHADKKGHLSTSTVSSSDVFSSLTAAEPTLALVPPGRCQFTPDLKSARLLQRGKVSNTTSVLRFAVPDESEPLNLSTCACILAKADLKTGGGDDEETEEVVRPYTPISTNAQIGSFDLLIKHYENGKMSQHMKSLKVGETIDFKHIKFNVKIQAPFPQKRICMIVGGTGVTPMIQALHAILGDESKRKTQRVDMLYGSKVSSDILGDELLTKWEETHGDQLRVTRILSDEPEHSKWEGKRGFIDADLIRSNFAPPSDGEDVIIFVCGPPPMYKALCGPREDKEVSGVLKDMGYADSQVYKF